MPRRRGPVIVSHARISTTAMVVVEYFWSGLDLWDEVRFLGGVDVPAVVFAC